MTPELAGGLRSPARSGRTAQRLRDAGARIRRVLHDFLAANAGAQDEVLRCLGDKAAAGPDPARIQRLRRLLAAEFDAPDFAPVDVEGRRGRLVPGLIEAIGRAAADPDADQLGPWLRNGAPCGIHHTVEPRGVFPPRDRDEDPIDPGELLVADPAEFANYRSVDGDPEQAAIVKAMLDADVANGFADWEDNAAGYAAPLHAGDGAMPSPTACLTKERPDGSLKHRLVLDLRRSQVNAARGKRTRSAPTERVLLPRLLDAADDVRDLLGELDTARGEELEDVNLDISDAYKIIPSNPTERRFFCIVFRQRVLRYFSLVFGAQIAGLLWCRFAAFLGRVTQALYSARAWRVQVYVDDPKLLARGTRPERDQMFAATFWLWLALGFPLSCGKGARGRPSPAARFSSVVWIGAELRIYPSHGEIAIPGAKAAEKVRAIRGVLRSNLIRVKQLRQLAGWGAWEAGLTPAMAPFVRELWGALTKPRADGRLWTRQVERPLRWLLALLEPDTARLALKRHIFPPTDPAGEPRLVCDASPWGLGAVLLEPHAHTQVLRPTAFFALDLPASALERYGAAVGDCRWQSLWELFVLVMAARHGAGRFSEGEVHAFSDSRAAIGAALRMASPSPSLNDLGAELALADATRHFRVALADHIAGVDNTLADALSRLSRGAAMPEELRGVARSTPPPFTWRAYPDRRFR